MKKYPVRFLDHDNKEDGKFKPLEMEERQLTQEEWPEDGDLLVLGRSRNLRVIDRAKVYGVKGLLRLEVHLSRRSGMERARDRLGAMSVQERLRNGYGSGD